MSSERFWVVILTAVTFLAGVAAGLLVADRVGPGPAAGPFAESAARMEYVSRMVETFDLSPEETRDLRYLIDRYQRDIEDLEARHVRDMEPELVRLGEVCTERIKKYVLPEDRREEFDRLAAGYAPSPGAPRPTP